MMMPIVAKLLPIELMNRNDGQGWSFRRSEKERKRIERKLRFIGFRRDPFAVAVGLRITRVMGRGERRWDEDSIGRGNAKQLVDALVSLGWFVDDSPRYVIRVDYRQCHWHRDLGPATFVEVFDEDEMAVSMMEEEKVILERLEAVEIDG